MKLKLSLLLGFCLTSNLYAAKVTEVATANVNLTSPTHRELSGLVQIFETKDGLKLTADVSGLEPGAVHGFHIHEKGKCKLPDFKSAGGHLNPEKHPHNSPAAHVKHLGDLGNLVANAQGKAHTEIFFPAEQHHDMNALVGKAVIIHAKADDLMTQPSGDSGGRISCGIIKKQEFK